jgi:uncharacterized protein YheU (UPF0270 family)
MNENFIEISYKDISDAALEGVVKNHLLKQLSSETTSFQFDLESKIASIKTKIANGAVKIVFDKASEEVIIVTKSDFIEYKNKQKELAPIWHGAQAPDQLPF